MGRRGTTTSSSKPEYPEPRCGKTSPSPLTFNTVADPDRSDPDRSVSPSQVLVTAPGTSVPLCAVAVAPPRSALLAPSEDPSTLLRGRTSRRRALNRRHFSSLASDSRRITRPGSRYVCAGEVGCYSHFIPAPCRRRGAVSRNSTAAPCVGRSRRPRTRSAERCFRTLRPPSAPVVPYSS